MVAYGGRPRAQYSDMQSVAAISVMIQPFVDSFVVRVTVVGGSQE